MDEQSKNSNRVLMIVGGVIIVVVIVGLIAFFAINGSNEDDTMEEETTEMVDTEEEEVTTVTAAGGVWDPELSIYENAVTATELGTVVAAVEAAGLVDALDSDGSLTVFLPLDAAFNTLPSGTVDSLLLPENVSQLQAVLQQHVVSGETLSTDLSDGDRLTTLSGEELVVYTQGGEVTVNGATVVTADVENSNGVVHIIDEVLLPPADSVEVGGVEIPRTNTILESAAVAEDLSTLVTAVGAANLTDALAAEGQEITVFAPVNAAFDALPAGTLDTLLLPENSDQLTGVLTYHVVMGSYGANQLYDGQELTTLSGLVLTVNKEGNVVTLTGGTDENVATVVVADIYQSNGVVHVIDTVLLPPAADQQ
jgi:uncharacterized surface protein with fasciclin (FAS1) repeats